MAITFENVKIVRATGAAVWAEFANGRREWIPISQVESDSEIWDEGEEGTLVISDWIASQKSLDPEDLDDGWQDQAKARYSPRN